MLKHICIICYGNVIVIVSFVYRVSNFELDDKENGYNAILQTAYRRLRNSLEQPNSTLFDYTRNLVATTIRMKFKIHFFFRNISELCKTMLRGGRGASFTVQPAAGVLEPFSEEMIEVTSFCDMWGDYTDQLICNVRLYLYLRMPQFLQLFALDHFMF